MANSRMVKYKDKKGNEFPYLYIDEMSGTFYVIKRINGEVRKKPLGTEFIKARAQVLSSIQEMSLDEKEVETDNLLIKDFYEMMIEEKISQEIKASTMIRIRGVWENALKEYWQYLTPKDVTPEKVLDFMTWHRRHRPGRQFVNVFKYLGNIFNIMVERGYLLPVDRPKLTIPNDEQKSHAKQKGRYIKDTEFKSISAVADETTWLLMHIAYCTGMRKMEIGSLHKSMVEKLGTRYVFKLDTDDTKTGLAREIPLPGYLTEAIKKQIDKPGDYLFPMPTDSSRFMSSQIIDRGWVSAKTKSTVKGTVRFHDIRHTAATNFARLNINPMVAVTMLGMSYQTYQKKYLKLKAQDLIIAPEAIAASLGPQP